MSLTLVCQNCEKTLGDGPSSDQNQPWYRKKGFCCEHCYNRDLKKKDGEKIVEFIKEILTFLPDEIKTAFEERFEARTLAGLDCGVEALVKEVINKLVEEKLKGSGNQHDAEKDHCSHLVRTCRGYATTCGRKHVGGAFVKWKRCNKDQCPFYNPGTGRIGYDGF